MIRVCPGCKKRYRYLRDTPTKHVQIWWCHACWRDLTARENTEIVVEDETPDASKADATTAH